MHRLFVAIRPPAAVRELLLDLMEGMPAARWQDDEQLHITLRFIGEVDARIADDVVAALGTVHHPKFEVALEGIGKFGSRGRVNALWSGLCPRDEIARLHRKIDHALVRTGLEPERRAYLPHITLARFGRDPAGLDDFLTRHAGLAGPRFAVAEFGLYESHLTRSGATYELVERYALRSELA